MGMKQEADLVSWEYLIERLLELFAAESVNIEEVEELLSRYKSDVRDWKKFAKFDKFKYTRNLVHEGNGKFNLMLLCWAEGNQSSIHDHADAHCFVKLLDGNLRETRYHWPEEKLDPGCGMVEKDRVEVKVNDVTYMCDELGLHRVENPSHSSKAVSLHLYSPPFTSCQVFDERTGKTSRAPMTFWSKYGEKRWSVVDSIRRQNSVTHAFQSSNSSSSSNMADKPHMQSIKENESTNPPTGLALSET